MDVACLFARVLTPIVYPFYRLHYKYKSYLKHRSMRKNIEKLQIANGTSFEGLAAIQVDKRLKVVTRKQELCKAVKDAWADLEGIIPKDTLKAASNIEGRVWPDPPPRKANESIPVKDEPLKPISEAVNDHLVSMLRDEEYFQRNRRRPPILEPVMNFEEELTLAEKLEMQITGNVRRK